MKTKHVLLSIVAVILLGISGAALYQSTRDVRPTRIPDLENEVARDVPGWSWQDVPIADSPGLQEAVDTLLNFDTGLFRVYRKGNIELAVYTAYWTPGRRSYREVHCHVPDVCWVYGGWKTLEGKSGFPFTVEDENLQPGDYRVMKRSGVVRYLLFWHLLQGDSFSYKNVGKPPWWSFIYDLWTQGFHQKQEQLFVRVSSSVPFEELEGDAGFQKIMHSLADLGLAAND